MKLFYFIGLLFALTYALHFPHTQDLKSAKSKVSNILRHISSSVSHLFKKDLSFDDLGQLKPDNVVDKLGQGLDNLLGNNSTQIKGPNGVKTPEATQEGKGKSTNSGALAHELSSAALLVVSLSTIYIS